MSVTNLKGVLNTGKTRKEWPLSDEFGEQVGGVDTNNSGATFLTA